MSKLEVKEIGTISGETEIKVTDPLVTDSIMPTFIKKRTPTNNPNVNDGLADENGGLNLIKNSLILYSGEDGSEGQGYNSIMVRHLTTPSAYIAIGSDPVDGAGYFQSRGGKTYFIGYDGDVETGTWTSHNYYIRTNQSVRQTYSADGTIARVVDGQAREMLDAQDMIDLLKGIKDAVNSQTTVEGMRSSIESISDTLISKYEDKVKEFVELEHPEGHGENL